MLTNKKNWRTDKPWITFPVADICFGYTAMECALTFFANEIGVPPQTVVVGPSDLTATYEVLTQMKLRLTVVCVPGMPEGTWFVAGAQAIYGSPGA